MDNGLSIVVCTNGKKLDSLYNCLCSLNEQLLKSKEIICVTPVELTTDLKIMIDTVVIEKRKGLSRARNAGIQIAKFKIIAFTDDDCICDSNWAINLLENFVSERIGGVTGRTLPFGEGSPISIIERLEKKVFQYNNNYISQYIIGHGNNMCFRKDILNRIGAFDVNFGVGSIYKSADDTDIMHKVLRVGFEIVYSPEALTYHESKKYLSVRKLFFDYGIGLGAFCRKYHKDKGIKKYFIFTILRFLRNIIFFDFESTMLFHRIGMVMGYIIYNDLWIWYYSKDEVNN